MRLDFNVLWVEDQPKAVAAQAVAITRNMAAEGFEFRPTYCESLAAVEGQLANDIFTDEIDLILVDWDLGNGPQGQQVISAIREKIYYKDIVFYSAVAETTKLKEASYNSGHEGIYFVDRNGLVDEVSNLFKSVIKKVLDLDHSRGIVMGATSDIDNMVRGCLLGACSSLEEQDRAAVLADMVALLDEKVPDLQKRVEKLKKAPSIDGILEKHLTFTANDGLRILVGLLGGEKFAAQSSHVGSIKQYMAEVVPKRNIYGHRVLTPEGKPGIAGDPGETIALDDLRVLRRLLLEMRQKFRDLHVALGGSA